MRVTSSTCWASVRPRNAASTSRGWRASICSTNRTTWCPRVASRWYRPVGPVSGSAMSWPPTISAGRYETASWTGRSEANMCRVRRTTGSPALLRPIAVHHLRHTTATLLKNLGVPARDAQIILGHSRLAITLEIYTHEDRQAQRQALGRISEALGHGNGLDRPGGE